jgi:hypothetical protein
VGCIAGHHHNSPPTHQPYARTQRAPCCVARRIDSRTDSELMAGAWMRGEWRPPPISPAWPPPNHLGARLVFIYQLQAPKAPRQRRGARPSALCAGAAGAGALDLVVKRCRCWRALASLPCVGHRTPQPSMMAPLKQASALLENGRWRRPPSAPRCCRARPRPSRPATRCRQRRPAGATRQAERPQGQERAGCMEGAFETNPNKSSTLNPELVCVV